MRVAGGRGNGTDDREGDMENDEALRRPERDRDDPELGRDDAADAARDFARALQEVMQPDADVFRIASETLQRHSEYDTP